jgi:hypothetical protein
MSDNKKSEIVNNVKNMLNEVEKQKNKMDKLINCRKLYDYLSSNWNYLTNNSKFVKFIGTCHAKLLEFEDDNYMKTQDVFYIDFYKKLFFPDIYGNLTIGEINNHKNTRNKYFEEDNDIKLFFDKLFNEYNKTTKIVNNTTANYDKPNVLFI